LERLCNPDDNACGKMPVLAVCYPTLIIQPLGALCGGGGEARAIAIVLCDRSLIMLLRNLQAPGQPKMTQQTIPFLHSHIPRSNSEYFIYNAYML
jgi:hypothetical protein